MEIDLLLLAGAPEPLDEHLVAPTDLPVHADPNLMRAEHAEEVGARKLCALISVEDLGRAEAMKRLLERGDPEVARERRRHAPREHLEPLGQLQYVSLKLASRT